MPEASMQMLAVKHSTHPFLRRQHFPQEEPRLILWSAGEGFRFPVNHDTNFANRLPVSRRLEFQNSAEAQDDDDDGRFVSTASSTKSGSKRRRIPPRLNHANVRSPGHRRLHTPRLEKPQGEARGGGRPKVGRQAPQRTPSNARPHRLPFPTSTRGRELVPRPRPVRSASRRQRRRPNRAL